MTIKTITINAQPASLWHALTEPALMQQWMLEEPILISTAWQVGSAISVSGTLHDIPFENKGTVLVFEPGLLLQYSHLSSLSGLADEPASYSIISFSLAPLPAGTALTLSISNFPTDVIYKHLAFYWAGTLEVLKRFVEDMADCKGPRSGAG